MKVAGRAYRSIWEADGEVRIIDQTLLPHELVVRTLATLDDACTAIATMQVRGAPLIGATAAYGMSLAARAAADDIALAAAARALVATRPTAVNLRWAVERMRSVLDGIPIAVRPTAAAAEAARIADEDIAANAALGAHGARLLAHLPRRHPGGPLQVLTHCNAGWLATVDWGTALAPIYALHDAGHPVHVWVDETRPRNQGAGLTAWELGHHGVPHTVVVDNAGGHLMQRGLVDACITGTDRTTARGDVANKIGTYLKALAAHDNGVPFYVAAPSTSIDWHARDGLAEIAIEERNPHEVTHVTGQAADGRVVTVAVTPPGSPAANPAFDVTPARLVTALITERGVCSATVEGLAGMFPELAATPALEPA